MRDPRSAALHSPRSIALPVLAISLALPFLALIAALLSSAQPAAAQTPAAQADASLEVLPNHHPQWANPDNLAAHLPASQPLSPMTIVLSRPPALQQAFEQFLAAQQDPTSPEYHHWLTPTEMGARFGLPDAQLSAVLGWLQSQGLTASWISPSRIFIGFGGTAGTVGKAFGTRFNTYSVNGVERISVATDPKIPASISTLVKSIRGFYEVQDQPLHQVRQAHQDGQASQYGDATRLKPEITVQGEHFLAPADFATIYDIPSASTGAGVTIGIVASSRTNFADFTQYRNKTNSTFPNPIEVVPTAFGGVDPGPAETAPPASGSPSDDQLEATLDVFRAGSVAPGAKLLLVTASRASGGIGVDAEYLVDTVPVPAKIMNISFGACESAAGASNVQFWDSLFETAAGEGISVMVASGDGGASGCDTYFATPPANPPANSPNYICSSSYATCVGGTEFNDANAATYWRSTNGTGLSSAISYIPEGAWNEPLNGNSKPQAAATGGGVSLVIATPSWQTGLGVPSARAGRYTPDMALSASGHDGYFGCFAAGGASCVPGTDGSYEFDIFFGTSAAAPDMAGIVALLDQKENSAAGNLNPTLYSLAAKTPSVFHDVTVNTSGVSNCVITTPSMCNNSIPGPTGLSGGQKGFLVDAGFDEATGLGSVDVATLLSSLETLPTVSSLTIAPTSVVSGGSGTVTVQLSAAAPTGGAAVSLTSTSTAFVPASTTLTIAAGATSGSVSFKAGTVTASTSVTVTASYNSSSKQAAVTITPAATAKAPTVTTGAASTIAGTTAKLNGTVNPNGSDTHVLFAYGTSSTLAGATKTASVDAGAGTAALSASASLTGLIANTKYYFQLQGSNSGGAANGAIASFTTSATAPTVTTGAASSIAATTATVGGTANPHGVDTHVVFVYGTSSTLAGAAKTASKDIGAGTATVSTTAALTGLVANTKYYFQIQGSNSSATASGAIASFTTKALAPTATTGAASAVTNKTASVAGTVNPNGTATTVLFLYGTSSTLAGASKTAAVSAGAGKTATAASAALTGLLGNTKYYFQIQATNSTGTTKGAIGSFTTKINPPTVVTGSVSAITGTAANLAGTVNPNGATTTALFLYGTSSTLAGGTKTTAKNVGAGTAVVDLSASLTTLKGSTKYYYQLQATSASGTTLGAIKSFTTAATH